MRMNKGPRERCRTSAVVVVGRKNSDHHHQMMDHLYR